MDAGLGLLVPAELTPDAGSGPLELPRRPDGPHLWLVRAGPFAPVAERLGPAVLDEEERGRADRYAAAGDRSLYRAAHVGLRLLLGRYLGTAPREVPLVRRACVLCGEAHGKPAVREDPLHFSLSRSGGVVLLGFAAVPLGVDAERLASPAVAAEVAGLLPVAEQAELASLAWERRPRAFTRFWARGEACAKGTGTGLARWPVSCGEAGHDVRTTPPAGWTVRGVDVGPGYEAAVAVCDTRNG